MKYKYKFLPEEKALNKILEEHYDEPQSLDLDVSDLGKGETKRLSSRFVAWNKEDREGVVLVFYERKWYERLYKYLNDFFKRWNKK